MYGVVIMHARSKLRNSLITEGGRIVIKNHEGGIFVKTIILGGRFVNCRIINSKTSSSYDNKVLCLNYTI